MPHAPRPSTANGRYLVAIPVYNEEKYVARVLAQVLEHSENVLVIDDGSTDRTPSLISGFPVDSIRHGHNRGYGRSLRDAFRWASCYDYDWVVTMDCDEQHEPASLPRFFAAALQDDSDIISGSRYMIPGGSDDSPPPDRRAINAEMTRIVNDRLGAAGIRLTDAFCGFKAHRVAALNRLDLTEDGYAFPMQLWVQCAAARLRVREIPVRLIYNDQNRTFGGPLNDPTQRRAHYLDVLSRELTRCADRLPSPVVCGVSAGCRCGQ